MFTLQDVPMRELRYRVQSLLQAWLHIYVCCVRAVSERSLYTDCQPAMATFWKHSRAFDECLNLFLHDWRKRVQVPVSEKDINSYKWNLYKFIIETLGWVRFPMGSLTCFIGLTLPATLWPWRRHSLWQKRIPGVSPGGKSGRCADCLRILEASTSWRLKDLSRVVQGLFYVYQRDM